MAVQRLFVEKKTPFAIATEQLKKDLMRDLHLEGLESLRIVQCYDTEGLGGTFDEVAHRVLAEVNVDHTYSELIPLEGEYLLIVKLLDGQYDQRADSARQVLEILTGKAGIAVKSSTWYLFKGALSSSDLMAIEGYLINPVEAEKGSAALPLTIEAHYPEPKPVSRIEGFTALDGQGLRSLLTDMGLAMSLDDLVHTQRYFKAVEQREPTVTEIKMLDTYWSDHCRHTTFATKIEDVVFGEGPHREVIRKAYDDYLEMKEAHPREREKPLTLMGLATINMKHKLRTGTLSDLDVSEEVNACTFHAPVKVDGQEEEYLILFKNETHNHPTEIEPFGGAATCLGGAIRDPLSGRAYVYQGMRVTGAADPRTPLEETLPGKLPQRKITKEACHGFSSYGNQIGMATGFVREIYHPGYLAKRMEVGAVIGATKAEDVRRETPRDGDLVVLIGGRTGRDGVGGATGSSKEHDETSLATCGSEVQKGNAPEERKLQRLFKIPEVKRMILRANDFGAGGVAVAVGEIAESLDINLDAVPKKYAGLDGTELALSESQERMAVVIAPEDLELLKGFAASENLEATPIATVTDTGRLEMTWRGDQIVNLSRDFLETNGVTPSVSIHVDGGTLDAEERELSFREGFERLTTDLNRGIHKGLVETFDGTVGAGSVIAPFGGRMGDTPAQGMVAKVHLDKGTTSTCTVMTQGFEPEDNERSPFYMGYYSVIDALARQAALGGNPAKVHLSLQEYFERLGTDPERWGKPFAALLGAIKAQKECNVAAIGGKDSMSGSFNELDVPPTLIAFAVSMAEVEEIVTPELKGPAHHLYLLEAPRTNDGLIDTKALLEGYRRLKGLKQEGLLLSSAAVEGGGIAETLAKMALGNRVGVEIRGEDALFARMPGALVIETKEAIQIDGFRALGMTMAEAALRKGPESIDLEELNRLMTEPLAGVFPLESGERGDVATLSYHAKNIVIAKEKVARPRVMIPVFPGTNCETDTARAFERAGAEVVEVLFRNRHQQDIAQSIEAFSKALRSAQILAIPGGFSAGDEPDGSGKFIASVFSHPRLSEELMRLLDERDGLTIGICNGFQALVKLGLLPDGKIHPLRPSDPTLTFNRIGRHVATFSSVRVASDLSPWFSQVKVGEIYKTAMSHGEGRFVADQEALDRLVASGQVATQYVDPAGQATMDGRYNPNGSVLAIEGITSADGRVLGKMGHVERYEEGLYQNIVGSKDMPVIAGGVRYFK